MQLIIKSIQVKTTSLGKILPNKYFVVMFALFCNREPSPPSNTLAPYGGPYFPFISYEDNM
ncbi:uncharacterized protein BJ212DRAFT_1356334 [Suillus subaureus]|uniref:Uncharacterized protein n=1 Tax=Suillus subaureus TaxID=48587 RepID=A0A9P7JDE1_9AGAM|nr:uncharacterized protein BJ212DRAFT_1356334 [Suillus subaureus]KAG1816087.1 hypothetical protein BJ212DRAFT_1356334 [Suillus subaureus]